MEPDHVKETPSRDFTVAAADGDICYGLRGLDDHRQELLAERGQAKRTNQNRQLAKRFECGARVRPGDVAFATRDGYERDWIRVALSGRSEISVM